MKEEEIRQLLDNYYNGHLAGEEEEKLHEYLSGDDVAEEFFDDRTVIFATSSLMADPEPDAGLEERIHARIDENIRYKRRTLFIRYFSGVAAMALILTGITIYLNRSAYRYPGDTYDDPVIAYNEAVKVLNTVSARMNAGTSEIRRISAFSEASEAGLRKVGRPAAKLTQTLEMVDLR